MIELICDKEQNLKEFTDNTCAQASFCFQRLLKEKEIKVNGVKVSTDVRLFAGDSVRYYMSEKQETATAFSTVYEDENILVIDKQSGVNAEAVFAELSRKRGGRVAFIHRLDRNTQGLMAFALNEKTGEKLLNAFREKKVEKRYIALCLGAFEKDSERLTAYLRKDEQRALVQVFDKPIKGAEKIVTEYRVIEKRGAETKVEIILHTGKTHQIRAHMAHISHPVVGDMKYGDTAENRARQATRQKLIAKFLRFELDGELAYLNEKTFVSKFDF